MNRLVVLVSAILLCFSSCASTVAVAAADADSSTNSVMHKQAARKEERKAGMFQTSPPVAAPTVVELVLETSGGVDAGFDQNRKDFDVLRQLVVTADLVDALNGGITDPITVFAPNDRAFFILAGELGYNGNYDEEEFFGFLAEALTGLANSLGVDLVALITDVLTYHVGLGRMSVKQLRRMRRFDTLQGTRIKVRRSRNKRRTILADAGPTFPKITKKQFNIKVKGGYVHVINRVLIPLVL